MRSVNFLGFYVSLPNIKSEFLSIYKVDYINIATQVKENLNIVFLFLKVNLISYAGYTLQNNLLPILSYQRGGCQNYC